MLNDCEISPTNYMIAFLRQRGWYLPDTTMRIPNVIPEVDPIAAKVCAALGICHCLSAFQTSAAGQGTSKQPHRGHVHTIGLLWHCLADVAHRHEVLIA